MAHDSRGPSLAPSLWRFTLRQFLAAVAFIALGCVALRSASSWWASAMLGLILFVLTASLLLVAYRRDADRAFWAGFATFGWVYVLLLVLGWTMDAGPLRTTSLVTNKLSRAAHGWLYSEATYPTMTGANSYSARSYGAGSYVPDGGYVHYGTADGSAMGYTAGAGMGSEGGSSMAGPPGSVGMPPGYGSMGPA